MDMVERVARIMCCGVERVCAAHPLGRCHIGQYEAEAKAAIRAMLEGLEPVAWRYAREEQALFAHEQDGYWQEKERRSGATETPLYDLSALKEVVG